MPGSDPLRALKSEPAESLGKGLSQGERRRAPSTFGYTNGAFVTLSVVWVRCYLFAGQTYESCSEHGVCPTRERHDGVEKERIPEATPIALAPDERYRVALLLCLVVFWATRVAPTRAAASAYLYGYDTALCSHSYPPGRLFDERSAALLSTEVQGLLSADATNDDKKTGARDVPGSLFV